MVVKALPCTSIPAGGRIAMTAYRHAFSATDLTIAPGVRATVVAARDPSRCGCGLAGVTRQRVASALYDEVWSTFGCKTLSLCLRSCRGGNEHLVSVVAFLNLVCNPSYKFNAAKRAFYSARDHTVRRCNCQPSASLIRDGISRKAWAEYVSPPASSGQLGEVTTL